MTSTRYVVFDVETTGLWPGRGDRVIEIGAIAMENRNMVKEFSTLIQIDRPIPRQARQVHGITQEMLNGQPKAKVVMPEFQEFIQDSILVAHNAKFDLLFLRREFQRQGLHFNFPSICTLEMSRARHPDLPNHRLDTVHRHLFGRQPDERQRHRALADARMVAAIWLAMEEG